MKTKDFDYQALMEQEVAAGESVPVLTAPDVWVTEVQERIKHRLKNDTAVIVEPSLYVGEVAVVDTPDHRVYLAAANKLLDVAKPGETYLLYGHAGEIVKVLQHRQYTKFEYACYNGNYLSVTFR